MKTLGHKRLDVCKVDIEGSEWGLLDDIIHNKLQIDQIFFEFHGFDFDPEDGYSEKVFERNWEAFEHP